MNGLTVKTYVDRLQSSGQYSFRKSDIHHRLKLSDSAINSALNRLIKKHRIAMIRQGFYTIIPLEYRNMGVLPAAWFIHQLMDYLGRPYYVALLSAAAIHGAAHQQPQEFQVITDQSVRAIHANGLRVKFFKKSNADFKKGVQQVKTESGYVDVSGPELTALDLIRYVRGVGGISRVSSVLEELSEKINPGKLLEAARRESNLPYIQRLGYILDLVGSENVTLKLHGWLREKKPAKTPLEPGRAYRDADFDDKWKIYVNTDIDTDLL
jgi:predicted transcriptional regulator of viral defense system